MESDLQYYRRRFADELTAAERAQSAAAEGCHRRLALIYSQRLSDIEDACSRLAQAA